MATMEVLLREDIENLGTRGQIVRVRAGYGRNYLLPRKLAVEATPGNIKLIEQEKKALLKREARERETAQAQAAEFGTLTLEFARKVGEHNILYGSVTALDIAEALQAKGYEIDRKKVLLKDPIKEPGEYDVPVKLHRDVTVEIKVLVTKEEGK